MGDMPKVLVRAVGWSTLAGVVIPRCQVAVFEQIAGESLPEFVLEFQLRSGSHKHCCGGHTLLVVEIELAQPPRQIGAAVVFDLLLLLLLCGEAQALEALCGHLGRAPLGLDSAHSTGWCQPPKAKHSQKGKDLEPMLASLRGRGLAMKPS